MATTAFYAKVEDFCDRLRQRRVNGSLAAAKGTAELMRQLVTSSKLNDPHTMLSEVRKVGTIIQAAKPIGTLVILPTHPPLATTDTSSLRISLYPYRRAGHRQYSA